MKFEQKLIHGKLLKRYKRFLSDIDLGNGQIVTAHCPNSGSMLSVLPKNANVWLSRTDNPKRKLKYTLEIIEVDGNKVGINTNHPNKIVSQSIRDGKIKELSGYESILREVKYGENSRIDILLKQENKPDCYVEVKNVTMKRGGKNSVNAEFPDAITTRGTKHLKELTQMVKEGHRAVMLFLVQRQDCNSFSIAGDIDAIYHTNLLKALASGVEVLCYQCRVNLKEINISGPLELELQNKII